MNCDEIPPLPDFERKDLHDVDIYTALNEFANSRNRFMFLETQNGDIRFYFDQLDAPLFASWVAKLSSPLYSDVYEFFKLVMEGARLAKQNNKRGFEMAGRIEKYIQKNRSSF